MLISQRPTLSEEVISGDRSRFVIEPLEPGFGYTLGNSLRRTLLSSIPGASVTSIKIDSVLHRSEERRVGKECVSTCRSRWSPYHYKKKERPYKNNRINT